MNNTFQTDDILISAYLLVRGAKLKEIISDRPRHFVFIFEDKPICEKLSIEYLNNGAVSARELFSRREELITRMRDNI